MNNVYIMSLEASDIYSYMNRGKKLDREYVGMIPYSLELIKLEQVGLKIIESARYNKLITNDIINIKFTQKVKSAEEIIRNVKKKIGELEKLENMNDEIKKLQQYILSLEKVKDEQFYKEIKNTDLREIFYNEGFTIEFRDDKKVEYTVFSRTSAKSRTGQVLFIKKQLRDKMIKWKRLGMNLGGRTDIDYPSLLSYESLVSSSIEDTIEINVDNILIIDDVKSVFSIDVNAVEKNREGKLESNIKNNYIMENELFDGEGCLDSSYFIKKGKLDKGMMLLRQHMFKSCVFNANIQQFLKDNCPSSIEYEKWELKNMFNQPILAKDVYMIITPSSLKALKFGHVKGSKKKMWEHWKNKIKEEGNVFGICKSEMQSKRGTDEEGNILNQTSYQMLNSMPLDLENVKDLSEFELDYIEKLKNDDEVYVKYLMQNANNMNSNEMLVNLYFRNTNIVNAKIFKDKRKTDIKKYVNHVKRGKVRLNGDYTTILGNGKELLYHSIRKLPVDSKGILNYEDWKNSMVLFDNEVYTKLHNFNKEYVAFRNPHTSPSNVLIVKNVYNEFIEKYFNLSENIIYVNAINFPIQRILSGMDYDSDTLIMFDNNILLNAANKCYKKYNVCVNEVEIEDTNKYTVCSTDMAKIDNVLSNSQKFIGRVVNLGQHYMSNYWDMINNNIYNSDKLNEAIKAVDICTILSEISIDSAKRMYTIDIAKQIRELSKSNLVNIEKPNFFKYISKNENINKKIRHYETSMDYLQMAMSNIQRADERKTVKLERLLIDKDTRKIKSKQVKSIIKLINEATDDIKRVESKYSNEKDDESKAEKYNKVDSIKNDSLNKLKRYKLKSETIIVIIQKIFSNELECKYKLDLLNILYRADKEKFIEVFKKVPEKNGCFFTF